MNKVSAIIAAKNEEPRIGAVLEVLKKNFLVEEIIVVANDCSDRTVEVAESYGSKVRVINEPRSIGKTRAIKKGVALAKNRCILLIDADLKNLKTTDITNLVTPVLERKVECTTSIRNNSFFCKLIDFDILTGERAMDKQILEDPYIWSHEKVGYSLEGLMNESFLKRKKSFISVVIQADAIRKKDKQRAINGLYSDMIMWLNVFKIIPFHKILWQIAKMSYLNRRYKNSLKSYSGC